MPIQFGQTLTIHKSVGDKGGHNQPGDVAVVKTLLNDNIARLRPFTRLPVDAVVRPEMVHMIKLFQRRVVGSKRPDGRVDPNGKTIRFLRDRAASAITDRSVPWLKKAYAEMGVEEGRGLNDNNPRIIQYMSLYPQLKTFSYERKGKATGHMMGDVDENPWCGCFVNWCMTRAGYRTFPKGYKAKQWMEFGDPLTDPRPGCICVVYKKPKPNASGQTTYSGNHVGFWTGGSGNWLTMLGGNQKDGGRGSVCEKVYRGQWTVRAFRWPKESDLASPPPPAQRGVGTLNLSLEGGGVGTLGLELEDGRNGSGNGVGTLGLELEDSPAIPLAQGTDPAISGRWFE